MQPWILQETQTADFGDERLDRRYQILLDRLSDKPALSIPAACGGLAETMAAYRFLANAWVDATNILEPHQDATLTRIREHPVVLIGQDTTEVDLTRKQEKVGGPLSDSSRWGLFAHVQLALTPQRLPLGVVGAEIWSRDEEGLTQSQQQKRKQRKQRAIEQKESHRWLEGYRSACAVAEQAPSTTVVSIADSEADIYELLMEKDQDTSKKAEWIVRACQDRAVKGSAQRLWQTLQQQPALGTLTVQVSKREATTGDGRKRRQPRSGRVATVTVRSGRVLLRPPARKGCKLPAVQVNAVLLHEEKPPPGEEAIVWLLLTSLPVETFAQACQAAEYYCCRWELEIYFRILKSGCKVEELQLEQESRMQAALALYLIVAWRVQFVVMMGREYPEVSCEAVLSESEWKSVYKIVTGEPPPRKPPPLAEMVELIGQLGGYLGRKHDGPPGPKAMWIGLQRLRDFAQAWESFGPGTKTRSV
jgi:hypothetical protein